MTTPANWRTARLSTGGHSINHGYSVGKEAPFIIYTDPRPFVFVEGDEVEIVDGNDPRKGQRGIVTARRVGFPNTYSVRLPYGIASIFSFKEWQIAKVEKKTAAIHPYATRGKTERARKSTTVYVDTFAWGDVTLPLIAASTLASRAGDYMRRQREKLPTLPAVIELEAQSQTTRQQIAHAAFEAFMVKAAALDIDPAQTARLNTTIAPLLIESNYERWCWMERYIKKPIAPSIKASLARPTPSNVQNRAKGQKQRQRRKIVDFPKMRVRRVAGL